MPGALTNLAEKSSAYFILLRKRRITHMKNKAPLTDMDRVRILELAYASGFKHKWVDLGQGKAEMSATPEAFWAFVETLLAQRG
jgi:hypothetical protein